MGVAYFWCLCKLSHIKCRCVALPRTDNRANSQMNFMIKGVHSFPSNFQAKHWISYCLAK